MTAWTDEDLAAIGDAREPLIAAARGDGAFRSDVTVWIVRVGDDLYMRSWRGRGGSWFRQALRSGRARVRAGDTVRTVTVEEADPQTRDAVDAAYRAKYGQGNSHVDEMTSPSAVEATLRLLPAA